MHYLSCNLSDTFKVGDNIWACEYKIADTNTRRLIHQTPARGILAAECTETKHNQKIMHYQQLGIEPHIAFFVPYQKNNPTKLSWSKAASIHNRCFFDDEQECRDAYNKKIDDNIALLQNRIQMHNNSIAEIKNLIATMQNEKY